MLIQDREDHYIAGPLDVIMILMLPAGTFHVAFYEEKPFPGKMSDDPRADTVVRLKSKMHHTIGAKTFEEAQAHLDDMRTKIGIPDTNVIRDVPYEIPDPVSIIIASNWLKENRAIELADFSRFSMELVRR